MSSSISNINSGNLSGITFSGLSSGIDTASIIDRMNQIEQIPIKNLQSQQQKLLGKKEMYNQLQVAIQTLVTKASALDFQNAFSPFTSSSSAPSVASLTLSGQPGTAGIYKLNVDQLAQAQKIASGQQPDSSSALGKTGSFVVNGKSVDVVASDSLLQIAQKINGSGANVTASLINGGQGKTYLTLTANTTGLDARIQMADTSGSVLSGLGFVTGEATVRNPSANGALSVGFADQTTPINTLSKGAIPVSNIQINGVSMSIDPSTEGLDQIAKNINDANAGVTAEVRSVVTAGTTSYQLAIKGKDGTPSFVDDHGVLGSIGILQQGYGSELVSAQDAKFDLDGVALTNPTNTVTDVIPGATIQLTQGPSTVNGVTTPAITTLSITSDVAAIKSKISDFTTAWNGVNDFIIAASQYDPASKVGGPLVGDSVAHHVSSELRSGLFNDVPGVTGAYKNLTSIGFSFDKTADIQIDDAALTKALATDPASVAALLKSVGSATTGTLEYVSGTSQTKSSASSPYAVNITQVATEGSYTGETAQMDASSQDETLTFNGSLFTNTPYKLKVPVGTDASGLVDLINGDATLKNVVSASLDASGKLQITSKKYGASGNFTAVSNLTAASDNSGLGVGSLGVALAGLDVAGTINGEPATGSGQFLTGNTGNLNTEGLQIQYTGTVTGAVGGIQYSKGVASMYAVLATQWIDKSSGFVSTSTKSLQDQYDTLQTRVDALSAAALRKSNDLKVRFANMETSIAAYHSQAQRLKAMFGY